MVLDERLIAKYLSQPIDYDTVSNLISASFLLSMAAWDRRCTRESFQEILMTACNFQNRILQIAEMEHALGILETKGVTEAVGDLKANIARYRNKAKQQQHDLLATLDLFQQMRTEENSVS